MEIWKVSEKSHPLTQQVIQVAATRLKQGELIAFPTETVYGLGANAFDEQAIQAIFQAKGRPSDNPLIVHIAESTQLEWVVPSDYQISLGMKRAMSHFWPGPLTFIVPVNPRIAKSVHPNLATVGVRMPNHPIARALIQLAQCPVAAPSANLSGKPSPTTAQDVLEDMDQRIAGLLDGGPCEIGVESTVVEILDTHAVIYRPGGVTLAQLERVLKMPVELDAHFITQTATPKAPGMKYRHYAPRAQVEVWWGAETAVAERMNRRAKELQQKENGQRLIAVMGTEEIVKQLDFSNHAQWMPNASTHYAEELAKALYHQLRHFDHLGIQHIFIMGVDPQIGIGLAVMNRLQKASSGNVHFI